MLELQEITRSFAGPRGKVDVLCGIDLRLERGEFVAVRGASGCGKSTLLLTAGGLLAPDAGRVLLDGQDLYQLRPDERATRRGRQIGFVFQQFHLVAYLSVRDNILAAAAAAPLADADRRADALLEDLGLAQRRDHKPAALSVGERQRVALARAMLHRPALILADEPTGNLDARNGQRVLDALAAYAREGGAVLLVTHDERAGRLAGRVLDLRDGRLLEQAIAP